MVELKFANIRPPPNQEYVVLNLSDPDDWHWAGVISMPPHAALRMVGKPRNELYVLDGSLIENGTERASGTFLGRGDVVPLQAGPRGATLFVYRDRLAKTSGNETVAPGERQWVQGSVKGMQVASLSATDHRLMLVSWLPGTRVGFHLHPRGEEILVLKGELCDQQGRYPAGSWLRFHPGSGHAPYAEVETTILLRNGHLQKQG